MRSSERLCVKNLINVTHIYLHVLHYGIIVKIIVYIHKNIYNLMWDYTKNTEIRYTFLYKGIVHNHRHIIYLFILMRRYNKKNRTQSNHYKLCKFNQIIKNIN